MSTRLVVSVRSAAEAALAVLGKASLIDVKEPALGSLGRASDATITSVLNQVAGRLPVSAALGELHQNRPLPWGWEGLAYLKWGLADCAGKDWQSVLTQKATRLGSRLVIAAYADSALAQAPPVEEIVSFACRAPWPDRVLLIDTFDKSLARQEANKQPAPRTLLDWLALEDLQAIRARCHAAGVRLALAGSLGLDEMRRLLPLKPDWFAVRGAVCVEGQRGQEFSAARLDQLVAFLHPQAPAAPAP